MEFITTRRIETPLGILTGAAVDHGICMLEYSDNHRDSNRLEKLQSRLGIGIIKSNHPFLDQLENELKEYFDNKRKEFDVPLVLMGTNFQEKVWEALRNIPYGSTISYMELANRLGNKLVIRAAGRANGQNPLAIVVPCHRVLGANGSLVGYGGGIWRKRFLINLERDKSQTLF